MANEIMLQVNRNSMVKVTPMMSINSVEDISFLKVLCISTARLAVMGGRRRAGKLERQNSSLNAKTKRQRHFWSSARSKIVAYQQRQATCCLETCEHMDIRLL
jgi:hypothetical protein